MSFRYWRRPILAVVLALAACHLARAGQTCAQIVAGEASDSLLAQQEQDRIRSAENDIRSLIGQYQARLGIHQDPFALAFTSRETDRIFRQLERRDVNGQIRKSPVPIVNQVLNKTYIESRRLNWNLMRWIQSDAQNLLLLQDPPTSRRDLQSEILALRMSLEYLYRYRTPDPTDTEEEEQQEQKSEKPKKESEKKQDQQKQQENDEPPEIPELPENYKPQMKETEDSSSSQAQKKYYAAEANFKTPFWGQRYFGQIVRGATKPFQSAPLPVPPLPVGSYRKTEKEMVFRPYGKTKVALFIPPLYKPLQPFESTRAKITRTDSGGYVLETTTAIPEVHIPLVPDDNIIMSPPLLDFYTRPVGIDIHEWPEEVQADILHRIPVEEAKQNPLKVAQNIADFLATQYLYVKSGKNIDDPIEALKYGKFKCDLAVYAMIALLRDVYHIPSRLVSGERARSPQKGWNGKTSYLVLPSQEGHVWVEVFNGGQWHLFDPTPVKKAKADEDGAPEDHDDIKLENTPDTEQPQQSSSESDAHDKTEHTERLDQDTESRLKEQQQSEPNEISASAGDEAKDPAESLTAEELAQNLSLGSLEMEPSERQNPLVERAARVLLRLILNPTQRGSDIVNRLNEVGSLLRRFHSQELTKLYQDAITAHQHEHPGLREWIEQLMSAMPRQSVTQSYQTLLRIKKAVEVYAQVLDPRGPIPKPYALLADLNRALAELHSLAHPNAQDIALVDQLVRELPPVVVELLRREYGLERVGNNAPTLKIAQLLKSGKFEDIRLLALLSPLTEFILNSTPRPEYKQIISWQRDMRKRWGRDLIPYQGRVSDLNHIYLGQPGLSLEDNIRAGTAFVWAHRRRILIPSGHGKEDAERITIYLNDVSGSMEGMKARFQAALGAAFAARAIGDRTANGRPRHRVILIPYGSKVGAPIYVTNTEQALAMLSNYQEQLGNKNESTDIQGAMLEAFAQIADAQKKAGEPLAAANIILSGDGGAKVDTAELRRARNAIDRRTPIQTMFVAIGETNPDLIAFAQDSQSIGAERGFYREFTMSHIEDIMREARTLKIDKDAFFSEDGPQRIPPSVYEFLGQAANQAIHFAGQIREGSRITSARDHYENFEKVRWRGIDHMDRPLEKWIIQLRKFMLAPVFTNRKLREGVVDDVMNHFQEITHVPFDDLSNYEQEQLRHWLRHGAGEESNP